MTAVTQTPSKHNGRLKGAVDRELGGEYIRILSQFLIFDIFAEQIDRAPEHAHSDERRCGLEVAVVQTGGVTTSCAMSMPRSFISILAETPANIAAALKGRLIGS